MKGRVIYTPAGKAKEYAEHAANFFVGCSNCCEYCYLKKGIGAKILGGNQPALKRSLYDPSTAIKIFQRELEYHRKELRNAGIFFSFTTDPLLPETYALTHEAVKICQQYNIPVSILTKCANGIDRFMEYSEQSKFDKSIIALGVTLTGCDDLEPYASPNKDRVKEIAVAHDKGYHTFASIEPLIARRFEDAISIIKSSYAFIDLYKIGLESGGKYMKRDLQYFYNKIIRYWDMYDNRPMIYWKNSIVKKLDLNREDMPDFCVDHKFNLFKIN